MGEILDDQNKTILFHYICQLLPDEVQAEFDRIAAATIAGDTPPTVTSSNAPEGLGDMLFHSRGEGLSNEGDNY